MSDSTPKPEVNAPEATAAPQVPRKTGDTILAACALLSAFFFWRWGVWGGFALGFSLSYGLFFALVTAFAARKFQRSLQWHHIVCGVTALGLSAGFAIFHDPLMQTINFFAIVCLTSWYICGLYQCAKYSQGSALCMVDILSMTVVYPFKHIGASMKTLFERQSEKKSRVGWAIAGVALAIPVLVVATWLLASADAAFAAVLYRLPQIVFGELIGQFFLALLFFFPLYSLLFALHNDLERHTDPPRDQSRKGRVEPVMVASFLSAISLLYVLYLFTQLAYFFSAFGGLLPEGFTLAEYARRGFFELCALAAINFVLVMLAAALARRRENGKLPKAVLANCLFICAWTLVIIASAQAKMMLYVSSMGLTRMRLLVSLFIMLLAVAFALMIVRILRPRFAYMKIMLAASCVLLLSITFADVDRTVMRYNLWAHETGRLELDVSAFWGLWDAQVPVLIDLAQNEAEDEQLRDDALSRLLWRYPAHEPPGWARWNFTRRQANAALEAFFAEPEQLWAWRRPATHKTICAEEAYRIMQSGGLFVLLDVRTEEEFAEQHIPGAHLVPLDDNFIITASRNLAGIEDWHILIYCRTGRRSAEAAAQLAGLGFPSVFDIGGIYDWPFETVTQR